MWKIVCVCTVAVLMAYLEVPSLLKKGWLKEMSIFLVLLCIGAGLIITRIQQVELPNPLKGILYIYEPVGKWIMKILS
ncbi:hypothetical protein [Paenibacillus montanisoli]|uniref:hypothetical protein n=1 Tax=Paenibacillus montanisoli TaxID=2081970 RepID=UPI001057BEB9|nr:hypothetical protein [Paenibacillus montanisoli]